MTPVLTCRSAYGSLPWFAVPASCPAPGAPDAVWLPSGPREIHTAFGTLTTDGHVRFFHTRRALIDAIAHPGSGYYATGRTQVTR